MIQLSYQPAFDPYHAMFRFLRIFAAIGRSTSMLADHARILDFYLLFPFKISGIRLIPQHRRFRAVAQHFENRRPYGDQPDDSLVFTRMKPLQVAALDTLAEKQLIDAPNWQQGIALRTQHSIAPPLAARVNRANKADAELMEVLTALATEYDLLGRDGLKDRTGLLEYRYDAV
ncbi:ABC-three component system middle component 5 [Bradyrhizobium zhanjiangense]|uniref:Uncharacterized protein n=1 Tax=Bradyrhizobium zhanjiangense TaxID=1325107 RepID=A0A4Q0SE19_9BRAD|nr:ABC-three component system middle component 5 [Bradyrhizobium zhanjiangense]RXH34393.1 hypothetical protein XH94_28040 [Bradyrhizobium zhanjiangense]